MDGLRIVCAWCGSTIRDAETNDAETTHGICLACYTRERTLANLEHDTELGGEG